MNGVKGERHPRASPSPTFSEQFEYSSQSSINQVSMLDDNGLSSSFQNVVINSPSFIPTASPIPLESARSDDAGIVPNGASFTSPGHKNHLDASTAHEHSSIFDQESRIDFPFDVHSLADDSDSGKTTNSKAPQKQQSDARKEREIMTLKEQDKTIDILNKENFELKMRIYYLEKRLSELSPDQVDNALKENIDLKVHTQTLLRELKKYKKMILEQNKAMDILERKQFCTEPHGMTAIEQQNYEKALATIAQQQEENTRLHKVVADVTAENARLRASVKSSRNSSPLAGHFRNSRSNSNNSLRGLYEDGENENDWLGSHHRRIPSSHRELVAETEFFRKELAQAKQTIEKQNQTIQLLREDNVRPVSSYNANDNHLLKSILLERDALVSKTERYMQINVELQEDIARLREQNTDAVAEILAKNKEMDKMHANMDGLSQALQDAKHQLKNRMKECQHLRQELAALRERQDLSRKGSPEMTELYENLDALRRENAKHVAHVEKLRHRLQEKDYVHQAEIEKLVTVIDQKEQEFTNLETQVVKLVERTDRLVAAEQEKDALIEELEQKLERRSPEGDNDELKLELERYKQELRLMDERVAEYERRMNELKKREDDIVTLEEKFAEMETEILEKDKLLKQVKEELDLTLRKAFEAQKRYERDLQELETQFQLVERSIRDRDVQIATLEGDLEAQADTTQREKELYQERYQEKIKEMQEKIQDMIQEIHEKDMYLKGLEQDLAGAKAMEQEYEQDIAALKEQMTSRMVEIEETWRGKVATLEKKLENVENEKLKSSHESGKGTHGASTVKNQKKRSSDAQGGQRSSQAQHILLSRLNQRVQQEPRDITLSLQKLAQENQRKEQENEELRKKIEDRERLVARLIEELGETNEKKASLEGVLLRQATDDIKHVNSTFRLR